MAKLVSVVMAAAGLGLAYAGWRWNAGLQAQPKTSFHNDPVGDPTGFKQIAAMLLLLAGLMLALVGAPIAWLSGR